MTPDASPCPPLPAFNFSLMVKRREALLAKVFTPEISPVTPIDPPALSRMTAKAARLLKLNRRRTALDDSLGHLLGKVLAPLEAWMTASRLAANLDRLKTHRAVRSVDWVDEASWALLQVTRVCPMVRFRKSTAGKFRPKKGAMLTFRVLSGLAVGMEFDRFWSDGMSSLAARQGGFSAPWGERPFEDIRQLYSLRVWALLDPTLIRDGRPGFKQVRLSSGCLTWNKKVLESRDRYKAPCPLQRPKSLPCYRCHAGTQHCPAATHRLTWIPGPCSKCGKETWFDPDSSAAECVNCRRATDLSTKRS